HGSPNDRSGRSWKCEVRSLKRRLESLPVDRSNRTRSILHRCVNLTGWLDELDHARPVIAVPSEGGEL
ncbi:MAG: hypothetical protein ABL921_13215, partial [Pirellula sp.]